jgi:hypothetical protein
LTNVEIGRNSSTFISKKNTFGKVLLNKLRIEKMM